MAVSESQYQRQRTSSLEELVQKSMDKNEKEIAGETAKCHFSIVLNNELCLSE